MIDFAQGDPHIENEGVNTGYHINMNRYWDLAQQFSKVSAYADFEGFAGPSHVNNILNNRRVLDTIDLYADTTHLEVGSVHVDWPTDEVKNQKEVERVRELLKDLVAHFVYENQDQGGVELDVHDVCQFIHHMGWLFTSARYLMKRNLTE